MNDLEDLLRDELRARAEQADAAAGERSTGPWSVAPWSAALGALDRRERTIRLRRRWQASALAAAAIAAAIIVPLALLQPPGQGGPGPRGPGQLASTGATPPGWTPLTYRHAQVSVPSSWVVQGPQGSICGVTTHGGLQLGRALNPEQMRRALCAFPATSVFVSAIPRRPSPVLPDRVNGIPVARSSGPLGSLTEFAPTLGVEVTALGPKARAVLGTLTRSPLSVVLARGRPAPVPAGWHRHRFGGITFAAPGGWRVQRTTKWGSCIGRPVTEGVARLSTARVFGCRGISSLPPLAGSYMPVAGITAGSGRVAAEGLQAGIFRSCIRLHGMRTCIVQPGTPASPFLSLVIYPAGRARPTVIEIGLAGTGAVPRAILDSIRPG